MRCFFGVIRDPSEDKVSTRSLLSGVNSQSLPNRSHAERGFENINKATHVHLNMQIKKTENKEMNSDRRVHQDEVEKGYL